MLRAIVFLPFAAGFLGIVPAQAGPIYDYVLDGVFAAQPVSGTDNRGFAGGTFNLSFSLDALAVPLSSGTGFANYSATVTGRIAGRNTLNLLNNPAVVSIVNNSASGTFDQIYVQFHTPGAGTTFPPLTFTNPQGFGFSFANTVLSSTAPSPFVLQNVNLANTQFSYALTANPSQNTVLAFRQGTTIVAGIPEPNTVLLFGAGLLAIGIYGRRRQSES